MHTSFSRGLAVILWGFLLLPMPAGAVPIVFSASGADPADIQSAVDNFRAVLGNPNNGNAPGPLTVGRREINWDGGGANTNAVVGSPFNGFRNTRGAQFTTPGTGFVQAPPAGGADGGLESVFGNPSYGATFEAFSPVRVFTPIGSNITDALFFIPGTNGAVAAAVSGFGAIFSDVDLAATTSIEYFDPNGNSLGTFFATPFDNGLSFLGVRFSNELISRVRITTGNSSLGPNDGAGVDVVVMDDFLYSEPRVVPEPSAWLLLATGLAGFRWRRSKP